MKETDAKAVAVHRSQKFFYGTALGRLLLKPLVGRGFSRLAGHFLDSRLSRRLIPGFLRSNGIDLSEYEEKDYTSFNDCFTRQIRSENRPFPTEPNILPAPCDGNLTAYKIDDNLRFFIKGSPYSVETLLGDRADKKLANRYGNGVLLVIRLDVNNYHRYAFVDGGNLEETVLIPGQFHTVNPIAFDRYPVFHRNTRAYTLQHSEHFGDLVYLEIGALLVGRICNHPRKENPHRGQEKGYFAYGGSTVALLLEADRIAIEPFLFTITEKGMEIPVRMGEAIGKAK